MSDTPAFLAFLRRGNEAGGFATDDVLAAVLPLLDQVAAAHEQGNVAPLDGVAAVRVEEGGLRVDDAGFHAPRKNIVRIEALQRPAATAVEIVGDTRRVADVGAGEVRETDLRIGEPGAEVVRPVYLPGYISWEHRVGHHDQLTDVFSLGLMLASLACGLDLTDDEDVALFVQNRENLFAISPQLHPVIAAMVLQMTELNRHRRPQTLEMVAQRLRTYRDQAVDYSIDYTRLKGFRESTPTGRTRILLGHLRNRLFEISRRNRLIHFKPTLQTLNLTLASVPLLLDHRNIRAEQLFLWHDPIAKALSNGESIVLGQYVRFEDAPYAAGVLDQIIASERRDRAEFGFAQLRLVICFLRWHNLKEDREERIHSPLLLLPVELTRRRGVRDVYVLKPLTSEAEVNPALRHHLHQLYGLNLPERIDLSATTLDAFHALLAEQIRASEPGVTLNKQDRPQIELIHERAQQRLEQFRRRQRLSQRGTRRFESFDYSYDRDRFRPLGVQLFHGRVKPARSPFAPAGGNPPAPRQPYIVEPTVPAAAARTEKEQRTYTVREPQGGGNPYLWDFDLCSQTLGNFNYRKMSLVQDYAALQDQDLASRAFEAVFSLQPRVSETESIPTVPLPEQFPAVDCDPTQMRAVIRARQGGSYIIQGPPGTGKSQTITNLIADFVARGKRVLFVCEKRAAIDVVFHRLGRQGLDVLCCLIHDSQTDKREFIRNLKQTYEAFLNEPLDQTLETRRTTLARQMELEVAALRRWTETLEGNVAECSLTVRDLLARLVELRPHVPQLDPLSFEQVPPYSLWPPHAGMVRSLCDALQRAGGTAALAMHPFRHLTERALNSPQPLATITAAVDESEALLAKIASALGAPGGELELNSLADIESVADYAAQLAPVAAVDALDLLNPRSTRAKKVTKTIREWRAAQHAHDKARAANAGWRERLGPADTKAALELARKFEASALRWVFPAYWKLRGLMRARYDFSPHAVPRPWSQLLEELAKEHEAAEAVAAARAEVVAVFGEFDADAGVALMENLPAQVQSLSPAAGALHTYLVENSEATYLVENLAALQPVITRLREPLGAVLAGYGAWSPEAVKDELRRLRADLVWLPDVLPLLADALRLPEPLQRALRRLPLSDRQLEAAMARKSLAGVYRADRNFEATDGRVLAQRVARLQTHHREWLALNASWIQQRVRREFLRKVQISTTPAGQLTEDEKELKRLYATGRRELEHEFAKTMRYRSIRDLAGGETGIVLRDLKPVWLMSPLSVSDTLPLSVDAFDVVIFDEASQILVEEAVPAVFRAPQVIVVGDEMQLPPTNFFSATRSNEESLLDDDAAAAVIQDLDADSFLTQSARNLPSTMLGWHYRSRSESLISFSNHAFYDARLLTIPDRQLPSGGRREIVVAAAADGAANVDALLARSVSFHFHPTAVYEQRCNAAEADYIAHLLRELLARNTGSSVGIVAFSEAQQGEIESALTRLGSEDPTFRNRLEAEYEREEDGQFCGLFVKNLENVQGDERDVILLSVCYGYDRGRRMLMNFGPINQRGGEKRLNVIFSRARLHMAVVSSIRHFDITNDYNDGANCLRNFLEYAAACSVGDEATARRVLQTTALGGMNTVTAGATRDTVPAQLAAALRVRGLLVEEEVGQSAFRLPLAVRRPDDNVHAVGILIDDAAHYAQKDLLERFLLRPGVLRAFGWQVLMVFTKDWFHDPEAVCRRVEETLAGVAAAPVAEPEPAPVAEPATRPAESGSSIHPLGATTAVAPIPTAISAPQPATARKPDAPERVAPAAAAPARDPAVAPAALRRLECTEDGSSKFWEASVNGGELTVRFGRIGTRGQTQTRAFTTAEAARNEQEKLIRSKLRKGYVER